MAEVPIYVPLGVSISTVEKQLRAMQIEFAKMSDLKGKKSKSVLYTGSIEQLKVQKNMIAVAPNTT